MRDRGVDLEHRPVGRVDAGVVDEVVEPAVPLGDVGEDLGAVVGVVGLARDRRCARAELGDRRVERLLLAPGDDDGRALVDEALGDGEADARGCRR